MNEAMYNALYGKFGGAPRMCYDYTLRLDPLFMAQVVLPRDLTSAEAERICAFIKTLAQPK